MNVRKRKFFAALLPVVAMLVISPAFLVRQLWFDEALTVLNFACLDSPLAIYRNYVIPNNQLLFTILIHGWIRLVPDGFPLDLWLRMPSLICAVALLVYIARRFGGMCGSLPLAIALTALATGTPFLVYATAVRGYMLSALLVMAALGSALDCAASDSRWPLFRYALFSLGAVATIPSNLAGLAAAVLFALPSFGNAFWKKWRFYYLATIPVLMLLAVYMPIYSRFRAVMRLGEGWRDGTASLWCILAAVIYTFAMLLVPASGALMAFIRKRYKFIRTSRAVIWLLPLPAALLLPAAPFPRVYFPLFPVFALLIAGGIRDLSARNIRLRCRWSAAAWFGSLVLLAVAWGWYSTSSAELRLAMSRRFGGRLGDDFFYGYYLRPDHAPLEVGEVLRTFGIGDVYFSFLSDPWAVMFYHRLSGGEARYLFDGPRGVVSTLPTGALAVLRRDESPDEVARRFGRRLVLITETPGCAVFSVEE